MPTAHLSGLFLLFTSASLLLVSVPLAVLAARHFPGLTSLTYQEAASARRVIFYGLLGALMVASIGGSVRVAASYRQHQEQFLQQPIISPNNGRMRDGLQHLETR